MNIKSLLLGSAAALAAACFLPIPDAMASPGGGGGAAIADPFETQLAFSNEVGVGPQLAELPQGGLIIEPDGGTTVSLEGDGGLKKPNLLGPQLALADKPGLVTIAAKTTSI